MNDVTTVRRILEEEEKKKQRESGSLLPSGKTMQPVLAASDDAVAALLRQLRGTDLAMLGKMASVQTEIRIRVLDKLGQLINN
jgi:hypothetical protein